MRVNLTVEPNRPSGGGGRVEAGTGGRGRTLLDLAQLRAVGAQPAALGLRVRVIVAPGCGGVTAAAAEAEA